VAFVLNRGYGLKKNARIIEAPWTWNGELIGAEIEFCAAKKALLFVIVSSTQTRVKKTGLHAPH
jgi:hypothetical protein